MPHTGLRFLIPINMRRTDSQQTLLRAGAQHPPQQLSATDLFIGHLGMPCVLSFPQGLPVDALRESLRQVLAHYPILTSRYQRGPDGHPLLDGSDAGLPFTVHTHPQDMPRCDASNPLRAGVLKWAPTIAPWSLVGRDVAPMQVRVHRFACGGALLAITAVHSLCDGSAFWTFMMDWVRTHHGHALVPPVLDRNAHIEAAAAWGAPADGAPGAQRGGLQEASVWARTRLYARLAWQHWVGLRDLHLLLDGALLASWQAQAAQDLPEAAPYSTHELATAWVLRAWSATLHDARERHLSTVTDLRHRKGLGLHRKYIGNALGRELSHMPATELAGPTLAHVAAACRARWPVSSVQALQASLGWLSKLRQGHRIHRLVADIMTLPASHSLLINNCAHFPIYKIDFGSGPPNWYETMRPPYPRVLITPSPARDGGLALQVTAHRAVLRRLNPQGGPAAS